MLNYGLLTWLYEILGSMLVILYYRLQLAAFRIFLRSPIYLKGKTAFVNRLRTGSYKTTYEPTLGVEIYALDFLTNHGKVRFYCWDTGGEVTGFGEGYYIHGECAIIMFDVTNKLTYNNVPNWYNDLRRICKAIPIVLCGNKADVADRQVQATGVTFHKEKNLPYYEVSAKDNYNLVNPFLFLARKLVGDDNLHFVESPEVHIDMAV